MATDICVRLGHRIRLLRTKKEWTQALLADHAGIGRVFLTEVENGRKEACIRTLEKLANALEIKMADLFDGL